jgi:hypothetical protein
MCLDNWKELILFCLSHSDKNNNYDGNSGMTRELHSFDQLTGPTEYSSG